MIPTFQLGGLGLSRSAGAIELVRESALHAAVTFARSTTGTYFDAAGLMQLAAIDAPRFEYDPATGEYLGLLIEPQRTNYALQSQALETSWAQQNIALTTNSQTAPDGTVTAETLTDNGTLGYHNVWQSSGLLDGSVYSRTAFVKKLTARYVCFGVAGTTSSAVNTWVFDFDTGSFTATGSSGAGQSARYIGNGVWRIEIKNVATTTNNNRLCVGISNGPARADTQYAGAGNTLFAWGMGFQNGDRPTSHIPTTTVSVTRSADSATFPTSLIDAAAGTFVIEHDCPVGDVLLGDGATALLVSQGPGKIAFAYDASGTMTVYNGGAGSTAAAIALGATLRILGSGAAQAIGHCEALTWYPGKQTEAWMQGQTT